MCGSGLKLVFIASFPGLPWLQFLIACSMQKTASDQKLEPGKYSSNCEYCEQDYSVLGTSVGMRLSVQRAIQPESYTVRELHSQSMFTHTLKGNVSAEAPNQTSSTLERNVFLLFSTATHNPLPLLCKAGGRAERLETHLHNINVRV